MPVPDDNGDDASLFDNADRRCPEGDSLGTLTTA
jgi:hypothetical protein